MRWPEDYGDGARLVRFPEDRWDPEFKKRIKEALKHRVDAIRLVEPPDVPTTRGELDLIRANLHASDFTARVPEIIQEDQGAPPSLFDPLRAGEDGPNKLTRKAVGMAVKWAVPYVMHFKSTWMRPRPNYLDSGIQKIVEVPGHPAYPSGHSTQAHLVALVGYEVCGDGIIGAKLWAAADKIAQNREYAGLHYRSDSACGVELARQLLPYFIEDHGKDIEAARAAEWSA